jgi:hypothetical protein
MKTIKIAGRGDGAHPRKIDVPETWDEGYDMLKEVLNSYYDRRGGNLERLSTVTRVAHGMFGDQIHDPTITLVCVMAMICVKEGAGIDPAPVRQSESPRRGSPLRSANQGDRPGEGRSLLGRASGETKGPPRSEDDPGI